MKFRKKPVVINAITFDELVQHGKDSGAPLTNGMPWSFNYNGHPITHENNDCYLIPTLEGIMKYNRGDMLITGVKGEIYPCKPDIFALTYEPATTPTELPFKEDVVKLNVVLGKAAILLLETWKGCGDDDNEPLDENGGDQRERGQKIKEFFLDQFNEMSAQTAQVALNAPNTTAGPADAKPKEE